MSFLLDSQNMNDTLCETLHCLQLLYTIFSRLKSNLVNYLNRCFNITLDFYRL